VHSRTSSNALNASVQSEQMCLQQSTEAVSTNDRISQIVTQCSSAHTVYVCSAYTARLVTTAKWYLVTNVVAWQSSNMVSTNEAVSSRVSTVMGDQLCLHIASLSI